MVVAGVVVVVGIMLAAFPSLGTVTTKTMTTVTTLTPLSAFAQTATNSSNNTTTMTTMQQLNGSINVKQAAKDFLNQHLNATLVDATDMAEEQVTNGTVVAGRLDAVQDSLVYNITVADLNSELAYRVYVDPSTGRVLAKSTEGTPLAELGSSAAGNVTNFENLTITLVDAANLAENQIPNGIAIAGDIEGSEGGNTGVVYSITVADVNGGILYKMTVDPNTNAVSTPQMMPMGNLGIGGVF
jgi:uncharacterized membrane protein YkoI